jgi:hypothetical protein
VLAVDAMLAPISMPAVGAVLAVDCMPDVMLTCVLVVIDVLAFVIVPALLAFLPTLPSRMLLACPLSMAGDLAVTQTRYRISRLPELLIKFAN